MRAVPGYVLEGRAARGESGDGAWFATDAQGRPVVLKWTTDLTARPRYEILAGALDALRTAGVPVARYLAIEETDDRLVIAQERLTGRTDVPVNERTVEHLLELNEHKAGVAAPWYRLGWGEFMVHTLTVGEDGWSVHDSLRTWSPRARELVERVEAIGAATDPAWFPATGIVHLDLHPGNLLLADDGAVAGIVDWDGAMRGDHRFDLTSFAFCTPVDSRGAAASTEPMWAALEATTDPRVLRAYAAHQALRLVDWVIRHHQPDDVERWIDASEALLARYDC